MVPRNRLPRSAFLALYVRVWAAFNARFGAWRVWSIGDAPSHAVLVVIVLSPSNPI